MDQALLIASSEAELTALAQTVIMATSSENVARKKNWEVIEVRYLAALMAHEKQSAKPKFENIKLLIEDRDLEKVAPVLKDVWVNDSEDVRKSVIGALSMRVIELCVYEDPFLGAK
jgi:hypothetical protein